MQTFTIDKKKFVIIEKKEFEKIQTLAAGKIPTAKELYLAAGRKYGPKIIDKWIKESKK